MPNNLLITGPSGIGKSTVLRNAAEAMKDLRVRGFLSAEIVESGHRVGWSVEGLSGLSGTLAHGSIESEFMLGSIGVDMELLEQIVTKEFLSCEPADLLVIDEIGIIGGWSETFEKAVSLAFDSETPVVAVLREKAGRLEDGVRQRTDVETLSVTAMSRNTLPEVVGRWVRQAIMIDRN